MTYLVEGFKYLMSDPYSLVLMTFGIFMGIVFGCIPGLTATLGVVLMIPITYSMGTIQGMATLLGIYVGGISGGLIAATLLNIPGTPSSIFTCWDAYPMTKKGEPGKALSIGVFASFIGGTFSALALIAIAPQLANIGLKFGYWELFSLVFMAMCIVAVMTEGDPLKSTISLVLGLILSCVGMDSISGLPRLTFGKWQLTGGFSSTAVMIGLFAVAEIANQAEELKKGEKYVVKNQKVSLLPPFSELKHTWRTLGIGSVFGTFIGILPAVGQQTASLLTYNQAKALSKHPENFGKGEPEGIVASESANNAVCGGALIPMITLGIPGDMTTAVLIGGLTIHGLQAGPLLFKENVSLVGAIMVIFLISNLIMYIMELGLMNIFVKAISLPKAYLFPFIIACCFLGIYALNNRIFDIWVLIAFGVAGYLLNKCGFPLTPVIMGFIMGTPFEKNFRRALIASKGNLLGFLDSPLATTFMILSVVFVVGILWLNKRNAKKAQK